MTATLPAAPVDALDRQQFATRHIGPEPDERDTMLAALGLSDLGELVDQAMPQAIRLTEPLDLPPALSESQTLEKLRRLAEANHPRRAMIGLGYHGTITPSVIRRNVLESPAWYTAYTPYQPEISQGRLEALLNFQTVVSDLTGLPTAGASLLDEATAVAEAMTLARRSVKTGQVLLVDADMLPQTWGVVRTRAAALGIEVVRAERPAERGARPDRRVRRGDPDPGRERPAGRDRRAPGDRRPGPRPRRPGDRGLRPARLRADHPAGGVGRRRRGRLQPAVRRAAVLRRPARRLHRGPGRPGADPARPAGRGVEGRRRHARRSGSPCRPASSTSAGRRRPPTSARRRCCWPSPPACTRSTTARTGCAPSPRRSTTGPASWPATWRRPGSEIVHRSFFDTVLARVPGRAAAVVAAAREAGVHLRLVDDDHVGISVGEDATEDGPGRRTRGVRRCGARARRRTATWPAASGPRRT